MQLTGDHADTHCTIYELKPPDPSPPHRCEAISVRSPTCQVLDADSHPNPLAARAYHRQPDWQVDKLLTRKGAIRFETKHSGSTLP